MSKGQARTRVRLGCCLLGCLALTGLAAEPANLLLNPGAEQPGRTAQTPASWSPMDFRTGGTSVWSADGGHSGTRCLVLRSATDQQRECWSQRQPVPDGCQAVAFRGWYRTRGVAARPNRGVSLRLHFHSAADRSSETGLRQWFYPPADHWTEAKAAVRLPAGTHAVEVQVFNWLTPGETHWDDLTLVPIATSEVPAMPLPDDQKLDREPVLGTNLPYHPADGDAVTLNPPPFRWLPAGSEVTYRLEVARDAAFAGGDTLRLTGLAYCAEMLTKPLATGVWYWRYGVDRATEPTAWSRARRFTVPASATPWPYPGRDSFQVPATHPRLFVTAADLPEFRRRATAGDLKRVADGLLANVKRFAGEPLIPEPPRLVDDRAKRGEQYAGIIRSTRPPMDRMETAGLAYLLTGDAAAGQEAKRRILHFFSWDPQGSTGVFHNDEPAMWIMMRGSRAYDWTWDLFTPAERAQVDAAMKVRANDFFQLLRRRPYENNPYESHAGRIIGFLGEAALEHLPEWPEARTWLDYIARIYWGVWPAWGKDDGGWNEGPGYWDAYMSFALHFVVALRQATGVDLSQRPFFHHTPYFRLYLTPPYSTMSPFGDGYQAGPSRATELMSWFSSLAHDPALRWYCDSLGYEGGSDVLSIVLKDDRLVGQPPVGLPSSRLFEGTGLAVLHSEFGNADRDVMLALRSTPYGAVSHGHNDQNCFVLEAFGEPLAVATGYYPWYGSPHHDGWTRQTKARNGLTIDGGQGQDRGWQAKGKIASFVTGERFDLVVGDATAAYGGRLTKAVRQLVHVRPGVFVVRDDLASAQPHRFEFRLHALDRMSIDDATRTVVTTRPKATLTTQFVLPEKLTITQDDQYLPPPETSLGLKPQNTWHLAAATEPVTAAEFLTVLAPRPTGAAAGPQVQRLTGVGATGVELRFADGSRTIVGFRQPGATHGQLGGVQSDGAIFAATFDARGRVLGSLLADGTELLVPSQPVIAARSPQTITTAVASDGGRIDTAGAGGQVTVTWPERPQALTRGAAALPVTGRQVSFTALAGQDSVMVWRGQPQPSGPLTIPVTVGDQRVTLTGSRYGRGQFVAAGRATVPAGAYTAALPTTATLRAASIDDAGRYWLRGATLLEVTGTGPAPTQLELKATAPVPTVAPQPVAKLPAGLTIEAEQGYHETGGRIEVSRGGHRGASGGANLWAWNAPGHALSWDLTVPQAGRYTLWLVGASETGLLLTAQFGGQPERGVLCAATGGWGRTTAADWQAFELPGTFELAAERQTLTLVNRSGLGLNLDLLRLVPVR